MKGDDIMFSLAFLKNRRGQTMVEYVMLLAIAALTATLIFNMDVGLRAKLVSFSEEWGVPITPFQGTPDAPTPICAEDEICQKLSPPVAKFTAPLDNYKGREVLFADQSFDTDGNVEHYFWSITGNGVNEKISQTAADTSSVGGLKYAFARAGNYNISLIVVDNDGLLSAPYQMSIRVLNRAPEINMQVENAAGDIGKTVTTGKSDGASCPVTFYTSYDDEDLPYDKLTLKSIFTDYAGTKTQESTVPNSFQRVFTNAGTYTYEVTVTDEDGGSAYDKVTVVVTDTPCNGATTQTGSNPVLKLEFKETTQFKGTSNGIPILEVQPTSLDAKVSIKPTVTWGKYSNGQTIPANVSPFYLKDSLKIYPNTFGKMSAFYAFKRGASNEEEVGFTLKDFTDAELKNGTLRLVTVRGQARDVRGDSTPETLGVGKSNVATISFYIKPVLVKQKEPIPILSLNGKYDSILNASTMCPKDGTTACIQKSVGLINAEKNDPYFNAKTGNYKVAWGMEKSKDGNGSTAGIAKYQITVAGKATSASPIVTITSSTNKKDVLPKESPVNIQKSSTTKKITKYLYVWDKKGERSKTYAKLSLLLVSQQPQALSAACMINGDNVMRSGTNVREKELVKISIKSGSGSRKFNLYDFNGQSNGWKTFSSSSSGYVTIKKGELGTDGFRWFGTNLDKSTVKTYKLKLSVRDSFNQEKTIDCTARYDDQPETSKAIRLNYMYIGERMQGNLSGMRVNAGNSYISSDGKNYVRGDQKVSSGQTQNESKKVAEFTGYLWEGRLVNYDRQGTDIDILTEARKVYEQGYDKLSKDYDLTTAGKPGAYFVGMVVSGPGGSQLSCTDSSIGMMGWSRGDVGEILSQELKGAKLCGKATYFLRFAQMKTTYRGDITYYYTFDDRVRKYDDANDYLPVLRDKFDNICVGKDAYNVLNYSRTGDKGTFYKGGKSYTSECGSTSWRNKTIGDHKGTYSKVATDAFDEM